jgi:PleD family two-component response regulator
LDHGESSAARGLLAGMSGIDTKNWRAPLALIANGQEWLLRSLESIIGPSGYAVLRAHDGKHAIEQSLASRPDVLLLDTALPGVDGFEVCRQLRADPRIGSSTPIVLSANGPWPRGERLEALRAGAWDMVSLPVDPTELLLRLEVYVAAKLHAERGREAGLVDFATGLYNPQGLVRRISEIAGEAERERRGIVCLVVAPEIHYEPPSDADAQSEQPDRAALEQIARSFRATLRVYDALGHVGPGEFVVLAPNTNREGARHIASRLAAVAERAVAEPPAGRIAVRAGCYAIDDLAAESVSPVSILVRATTALRASQSSPDGDWIRFFETSN